MKVLTDYSQTITRQFKRTNRCTRTKVSKTDTLEEGPHCEEFPHLKSLHILINSSKQRWERHNKKPGVPAGPRPFPTARALHPPSPDATLPLCSHPCPALSQARERSQPQHYVFLAPYLQWGCSHHLVTLDNVMSPSSDKLVQSWEEHKGGMDKRGQETQFFHSYTNTYRHTCICYENLISE